MSFLKFTLLHVSSWFQNELPSSRLNNTPPMGAPKAAEMIEFILLIKDSLHLNYNNFFLQLLYTFVEYLIYKGYIVFNLFNDLLTEKCIQTSIIRISVIPSSLSRPSFLFAIRHFLKV